jgi:tripartite-type tricarboxylate transporter receptor subunit TctC
VPPQVVQKLGAALRKAMSVESVRERYRSMGVDIMDMDQAAFAAYVRADYEKWRRVARDGNIVVD